MIKKIAIASILSILLVGITPAMAHPGRLDSRGGHYCRVSKIKCENKWKVEYQKWHKHKSINKKLSSKKVSK